MDHFASDHALVGRLRRLRARAERERTALCYAEGLGAVTQALRADAAIERCLVAPALLPPGGAALLAELRAAGVPIQPLAPRALAAISFKEGRHGIGAVVATRVDPIAAVDPGAGSWVALSRVGNPGNLGAVMRTCDAVGCAGLILLGDTADPHHPDAVRASRGTVFALRLVRASVTELLDWTRRHGVRVVGSSPAAAAEYRAVRYPRPLVVLLGSEREGLSPAERALCNRLVRVPMVGRADSLNLAVAAAVLLYEVYHQHRADASTGSAAEVPRAPLP